MACFSVYDVGGCGCAGCYPCPLPPTDLTGTWVVPAGPNAGTYTPTLTYSTAGSLHRYDGGFTLPSGATVSIELGCNPSTPCSFLAISVDTDTSSLPGGWDHPAGCGGVAGPLVVTLSTWTCSPLSITWLVSFNSSTLTITP